MYENVQFFAITLLIVVIFTVPFFIYTVLPEVAIGLRTFREEIVTL